MNTRPHNVCERPSLQLPERHIKGNCGTQEPLASRACDNRSIKSGSLDIDTTHAHKRQSQAQYPVLCKPSAGVAGLIAICGSVSGKG